MFALRLLETVFNARVSKCERCDIECLSGAGEDGEPRRRGGDGIVGLGRFKVKALREGTGSGSADDGLGTCGMSGMFLEGDLLRSKTRGRFDSSPDNPEVQECLSSA